MSIICAPFSICCFAINTASSKFSSIKLSDVGGEEQVSSVQQNNISEEELVNKVKKSVRIYNLSKFLRKIRKISQKEQQLQKVQ